MIKKLITVVLIVLMSACQSQSQSFEEENKNNYIGSPTPQEILLENPDADIFMLNGIVYMNAEEVDWISELSLSSGEEISEIRNQTDEIDEFKNSTATHLPAGTKIYQPNEKHGEILLVLVDGDEKRYYGLIEG